jgi:transcriptional regulator with XRE-family HTH domain
MQAISHNFFKARYNGVMPAGRPAKQARTTFGERLASARESAGLTQLQLAQRLGTSQRVITYWERETVALRADQLSTLADALGVSADFLIGRETPKPRGSGPTGRMRQLFDAASKLPRHEQQHVVSLLRAFVRQHTKDAPKTI